MTPRFFIIAATLFGLAHVAAAQQVLTPRMHHLRGGQDREWADFPDNAESKSLAIKFQSTRTEKSLSLRHIDIKQTWKVTLNGRTIATLPQDENHTLTYWPVPSDALREGDNTLEVIGPVSPIIPSDDISIGDIRLHEKTLDKLLFESTLDVQVLDADANQPLPARITLTDQNGAHAMTGLKSSPNIAARPGVIYTATGQASIPLPAGKYTLHASRGFEYSLESTTIEITPGQTVEKVLKIRREVPTPGYAASDTHIHTFTHAKHGDATLDERLVTLAGEGIELPISTEHNLYIDLDAPARAANLRQHFTPILGIEITSPSRGHFNVFPVPPGAAVIDPKIANWDSLAHAIRQTAGEPVIILNHALDLHGGFRPLDPIRHLAPTGENLSGWKLPANAMEVINSGATRSDTLGLFHAWIGLLNRGHRLTPIGCSDSHDVSRYIVGQARTYVRCDDSNPGQIDPSEAAASFRAGRALVSYGLLVDLDINNQSPGDLVKLEKDKIQVNLRVLGPGWSKASKITLFANGIPIKEATIDDPGKSGLKWQATWTLDRPKHDIHLVALAQGPGITSPHWPMARPYQPTSPTYSPASFACTAPIWIDADGQDGFTSAFQYAQRLTADNPDFNNLLDKLNDFDSAVAAQAAGILIKTPDGEAALKRALPATRPHIRDAFQRLLEAWDKRALEFR